MQDLYIPRRAMTLFLLVDSSGSMSINGNMGKVNGAIEEMIPLLRDISDDNADAEIKLAVLEFSSGCKWATGDAGPVSLDDFDWNDMKASGLTDMGAAFYELERRLSRKEFMNNAAGNYAPVIILLSDGAPTDDYVGGLKALQCNNWFRHAVKIAISVEGSQVDVLSAFTGSEQTVVPYNSEKGDLKKLLTTMALVSSTIQSRSKGVDPADSGVDATSGEDEDPGTKTAKEIVQQVVNETAEKNDDPVWDIEW